MDYGFMLNLAREHSFTSFTELQELAFRADDTYNYNRDLFVIGETSSGKTLIPLLIFEAAVREAEMRGEEYPKMLFVVPYRALAAQKTIEMKRFFEKRDMKIVQSTGEFRQDDDLIQSAQVNIAIVITEKIYKYASRDPSFLEKYDYIVLDEIGLINNAERGIRLDFIFAWAKNQKSHAGSPRIIALGTPFFDWSAYIGSYDFTAIALDRRPVRLNEIVVSYAEGGIEQVEGECPFLHRVRRVSEKVYQNMAKHVAAPGSRCEYLDQKVREERGGEEGDPEFCPYKTPCRLDPSLPCSITGKPCPNWVEFVPEDDKKIFPYILTQICREHLKAGHQILIFVNDRTKVMELCSLLYRRLKEYLAPAPSAEECKKVLLKECELESEDVFGIMESDDEKQAEFYQAFISGIGFHSAALPNELRTYVEKKLLEGKDMRIVCSTETLAYGVNSSVDVVIVADLYKHEGGDVRPLSLNEFQNYSGRAGRIRKHTDFSDIKGYVYTLVNKNQGKQWAEMNENRSKPEKLYSLFHLDQGQFMPFFLINILPATSDGSMAIEDIVRAVQNLPRDGSVEDELLEQKIQTALQFLVQHGLAVGGVRVGRGQRDGGAKVKKYCLSELGKRLRGHIIGCDDYDALRTAVSEYLDSIFVEPDKAKFLFSLLCTKHAETGLNSIFSDSESRISIKEVREDLKRYLANGDELTWIDTCKNTRVMFILAALLAWGEGESPKYLYRHYGTHYALLNKLAEQIAYLIEMAREILPSQMEEIYRKKEAQYTKWSITFEDYLEAVNEKVEEMSNLFVSVYYGINTKIVQELLDFLQTRSSDAEAVKLMDEFSLQYVSPTSARKIRRLVIRYKFFADKPEVDMSNMEMRNNFMDQYRRYKKDVEQFGPHILAFFRKKFPSDFTN